MFQALLLDFQAGLRGLDARFGGLLGRLVLVDLLLAQCAGRLERARSFGVASGLLGVGLRFHQRSSGLGDIGQNGLGTKHSQDLPRADHIAHTGTYFQQPQAVGLAADAGFLPSGDVAIGA